MADRLGVELDRGLPAEVEHRLPGILKPVIPCARHAVIRFAPAELVDETPSPYAAVRDDEVLHVQATLALVRVLLHIQKVRTIRRQDRCNVGRNRAVPLDVLGRRYWLKAAGRIVFALRRVRW